MSIALIKHHADVVLEEIGHAQHELAKENIDGAIRILETVEYHANVISNRCEENMLVSLRRFVTQLKR